MKRRSAHEPKAKLMSAPEVWEDAQQLAYVLRENLLKAGPLVWLQVPLSAFLAALDNLSRDELLLLRKHVDARLTA
jgi:hypothetical protein